MVRWIVVLLFVGLGAPAAAQSGTPPTAGLPAEEMARVVPTTRLPGERTASGEAYDPHRLTLAHPTLPFGTIVEVVFPRTGRTVRARVNDRVGAAGPVHLSERAAAALGLPPAGGSAVLRLDPVERAFAETRLRQAERASPVAAEPAPAERLPGPAGWAQRFTVQLGAFSDEGRARAVAAAVEGAWVEPVPGSGLWRVCYGIFPDRAAALAARDRLATQGREGFVRSVTGG